MVLAMEKLDELMESEEVTWRDILYEVLKGLDPWDVDLVELATRYSSKVDEMREMNFRIPANVILVCSVLLRMKADILTPKKQDYEDYATALNFIFNADYPINAILGGEIEPYPITIKPARSLTRRVTANELIEAIQDALRDRTKVQQRRALKATQKVRQESEEIVLEPEINIMEIIEQTYQKVMSSLSQKEVVLFSEMAKTRDDVLNIFLSLLHLNNSERLSISQESLFGEIYIRTV